MQAEDTFARLVIDPAYTLEEYGQQFDYDLVGKPVSTTQQFLNEPLVHLAYILENYAFLLLICALAFLFFGFFASALLNMGQSAISKWRIWDQMTVAMRLSDLEQIARMRLGWPPDSDKCAHFLYRGLSAWYETHKRSEPADTVVEYEGVRFALEAAWPSGVNLETLTLAEKRMLFEHLGFEAKEFRREEKLRRLVERRRKWKSLRSRFGVMYADRVLGFEEDDKQLISPFLPCAPYRLKPSPPKYYRKSFSGDLDLATLRDLHDAGWIKEYHKRLQAALWLARHRRLAADSKEPPGICRAPPEPKSHEQIRREMELYLHGIRDDHGHYTTGGKQPLYGISPTMSSRSLTPTSQIEDKALQHSRDVVRIKKGKTAHDKRIDRREYLSSSPKTVVSRLPPARPISPQSVLSTLSTHTGKRRHYPRRHNCSSTSPSTPSTAANEYKRLRQIFSTLPPEEGVPVPTPTVLPRGRCEVFRRKKGKK